tara:strand:- start:1779 stop:1973 length:195 start_codon:yes stop_codon:yes gene_type:complete
MNTTDGEMVSTKSAYPPAGTASAVVGANVAIEVDAKAAAKTKGATRLGDFNFVRDVMLVSLILQ